MFSVHQSSWMLHTCGGWCLAAAPPRVFMFWRAGGFLRRRSEASRRSLLPGRRRIPSSASSSCFTTAPPLLWCFSSIFLSVDPASEISRWCFELCHLSRGLTLASGITSAALLPLSNNRLAEGKRKTHSRMSSMRCCLFLPWGSGKGDDGCYE